MRVSEDSILTHTNTYRWGVVTKGSHLFFAASGDSRKRTPNASTSLPSGRNPAEILRQGLMTPSFSLQ
jgi:hypothetical protein